MHKHRRDKRCEHSTTGASVSIEGATAWTACGIVKGVLQVLPVALNAGAD